VAAISRLAFNSSATAVTVTPQPIERPDVLPAGQAQDWAAICAARKRPSTGVAARKGRERPRPRPANAAPGPTGGVAHAPMSVSGCAGARVSCAWKCCPLSARTWAQVSSRKEQQTLLPFCRGVRIAPNRPGVIACWFCCPLRFPIFRERLGASRVHFAAARPWPARRAPDALQLPERRARGGFDSWLSHFFP